MPVSWGLISGYSNLMRMASLISKRLMSFCLRNMQNASYFLIKLEKPEINRQDTGISRTLKLFFENVIPQIPHIYIYGCSRIAVPHSHPFHNFTLLLKSIKFVKNISVFI